MKSLILKILLLIVVTLPILGFTASLDYVQLAPLPGSCEVQSNGQCITKIGENNNLAGYINSLYMLIVGAAGVLAVLQIVMGGFSYLSTDAIANKEEGKHQIKMALGGLMLIFASYIILNTINPQLVELKIINDPLKSASFKDLGEMMMYGRMAQERFGLAMDRTLADLNKIKENRDAIRQDAALISQKAQSYRDASRLKTLMDSPIEPNSDDPEKNGQKIKQMRDEYFYALSEMTDEEFKDYINKSLPTLENEIMMETGKATPGEALAALEAKAKDINNYADAIQKSKTVAVDGGKKVTEFKEAIRKNSDVVYDANETGLYINAIKNDVAQREENIKKLNLSDQNESNKLINEMKSAANDSLRKICSEIPKTVNRKVGNTSGGFSLRIENNPGYSQCVDITGPY